jgi:hypothetical protein
MSGVVYSRGEMIQHLGEMKRASPRLLIVVLALHKSLFSLWRRRGILLD